MKKTNSALLSMIFVLTIFVLTTKLQATTTTAGAAPTSTSGMYQPQSQGNVNTRQTQKSGPVTNTLPTTSTFCVNSGILGERCGVKAVQYCKQNPDNPDCKKRLTDTNETK